ncbi:MAG: hypothetical protein WC967_14760 [Balneolaceae bacterium]
MTTNIIFVLLLAALLIKINIELKTKLMAEYTKKQRITSSKQDCICDETGVIISKHERILFDPVQKKVYSSKSKMYQNYINQSKK